MTYSRNCDNSSLTIKVMVNDSDNLTEVQWPNPMSRCNHVPEKVHLSLTFLELQRESSENEKLI